MRTGDGKVSLLRWIVLVLVLAGPVLACDAPADLAGLRASLLSATNAHRVSAGRESLQAEALLDRVAQAQACHMADRERLTHRGRWFAGLGRRLRREGYAYAMAVENIGEGQRSAAEVVAGWMDSPSHRENMLAPAAREVGFGAARAANGRLHWAMVAASPL